MGNLRDGGSFQVHDEQREKAQRWLRLTGAGDESDAIDEESHVDAAIELGMLACLLLHDSCYG